MSGGSHNYVYSDLALALDIPTGHYGKIGDAACNEAVRKENPMEDLELSEMMYDVTCLLHSLEWYHSSDTCEDTYRKDVKAFKDKWFGSRDARLEKMINDATEDMKRELLAMLGREE